MSKRIAVSIGIPAYNEGKNIQKLLVSLLAQKETSVQIKEILVVSDGSTDDTRQKVKALKDKRIIFKDDGKRLGKSARLNYIFKTFTGDVLFLMDADITITDHTIIARTIRNGKLPKSGLVGVNAQPLPATTYVEKTLETSVALMKDIAKSWNNGQNYLSFKGCFLALDGKFAKSLHMPAHIVNNDAFLYFAALQSGFSPAYLSQTRVYYHSPKTIADHMKQSSRYQSSQQELRQHFTMNIDKEYKIPSHVIVQSMIKSLVSRPVTTLSYVWIAFYAKLHKQTNHKSAWSIARTTK